MQTEERTVEQFTDNAPFQQPLPVINRALTRYLFLALNLTETRRIRQVEYLNGGGKEVDTPGLSRTHKFLRRGRITPLEKSFHPVARGMEPEGSEVFDLPLPRTEGVQVFVSSAGPLVGVVTYPGDELPNILSGSSNMAQGQPIGIVEISALRGHEYKAQDLGNGIIYDRDLWKIQREIFPEYPLVPVLLSDIQVRAEEAYSGSGLVSRVAEDILLGCEQSLAYASGVIDQAHNRMKESANDSGYVHRYSDVEISLVEQLGVPRRDKEMAEAAAQTRQTMQALQQIASNQGVDVAGIVEVVQKAADANQAAFLSALERLTTPEKKTRAKKADNEPSEDE